MSRNAVNGLPSTYATGKLPMLVSRRQTPLRGLLARMAPIAFPGCDANAWIDVLLGFTAFSTSAREDTVEAPGSTVSFHEVGLFQVPAGPRGGPAPNPNPRAPDNAYGRLATSAMVRAMLGRAASLEPGAWKPSNSDYSIPGNLRALEDQTAVGLANLREDFDSLKRMCERAAPGSSGASNSWSAWQASMMFTAMSRGPTGAFNRLAPYLVRLAAIPETARIQRLAELVDADVRARAPGIGGAVGRGGTSYGEVRSLQKLYSGRAVAIAAGGNSSFFAPVVLDAQLEQRLAQAAYGASISSVAESAAETISDVAKIASETIVFGSDTSKITIAALAVGGFLSLVVATLYFGDFGD